MRIVRGVHQHVVAQKPGDVLQHVLALVMLDAAEEPAAHHVFGWRHFQWRGGTDIDRLLVHAPGPEWQPAEAAFQHAHAQPRIAVEHAPTDERRGEPHRAPGMRGKPAQEDVVVQVAVAGIVRRGPGEAMVGDRQVVLLRFRQIGSRLGWSTGNPSATSGITATAHFALAQVRISRTASSTSRVEAMIGPVSRSGCCPQKSAMWRWKARIIATSIELSSTPTKLSHDVGIRKCTSVPSSSMSFTRLSAWSSWMPARGRRVPIHFEIPPAEGFARRCLTQDASIAFGAGAIGVQIAVPLDGLADRQPVWRQFRQPRPEVGIERTCRALRRRG